MRFKLTIEYAGTRYSGWQIQKNARTVQGEIDRAIREVTGVQRVRALRLRPDRRRRPRARPGRAPRHRHDAAARDAAAAHQRRAAVRHQHPARSSKVRHRFHARHDAVARSYIYQIVAPAHGVRQAVRLVGQGGSRSSTRCARAAAGSSACTTSSRSRTTTRTRSRRRCSSTALDVHEDGDLIVVHIEGSHFIWKMVRRLVGVLVEVGRGGLSVDDAAATAGRSDRRCRRA